MKKNKYFKFYGLWLVLEKALAMLPLQIFAIVKWDDYFGQKTAFNNMIGIVLLSIFMVIIVSKKAAILKGCFGFIFVTIIAYFLRDIINDLVWMSGLASLGMIISNVAGMFKAFYKNKYEKYDSATISKEVFTEKESLLEPLIERTGKF